MSGTRESLCVPHPVDQLADWVREAHTTTRRLVDDLTDEQMLGPRKPTVNPPLWELGHVAWFYDRWALRHAGRSRPVLATSDALYDSMAIEHGIRWDLALPNRQSAYDYADNVRDCVLEQLSNGSDPHIAYHVLYSILHEDMHAEAFAYARQCLAWPRPRLVEEICGNGVDASAMLDGDADLEGGVLRLGAEQDADFVFDNEKWAHPQIVAPFSIARTPVTQQAFAHFVDDGGYTDSRMWCTRGWRWRQRERAECPVYWRHDGSTWLRRDCTEWVPLEPRRPMVHLSWFEAEAYCRWAGRRLPTEAEWELAASASNAQGTAEEAGRVFPWGASPPSEPLANLGGRRGGPICVDDLAAGESAVGCRQMIGNVWEWTASAFHPYPGFTADPYAEYSAPWFGEERQVLRGGSWATSSRLVRNTMRNFFPPDRRDVWAGFRTCRL